MRESLKRIAAFALVGAMSLSFAGCGSKKTAETTPTTTQAPTTTQTEGKKVEATKLSVSLTASAQSSWNKGLEKFAEIINTESKGKYKVQVYPSGVLCEKDWKKMLEQTKNGDPSQIGIESFTAMSTIVPELSAVSLPFLFKDSAQFNKFLDSNPAIWQKWLGKFEDNGLVVLAVAPRPFRQLINNKQLVKTPADIKGLPFRIPTNPFFESVFNAMGAKPVPLASGEIYSSIQTGKTVGEDNSVPVVYDFKTHEVAKYMTLWDYIADGSLLVMNKAAYSKLDAAEKELFKKAAKEFIAINNKSDADLTVKAKEEMTKAGVQFYEMPDTGKAEFKKLMTPVYADIEKQLGADAYKEFMAAVESVK